MSLKDFVIISKLGEGAYSSVYKVQRIVDSQIYALKKVKMNSLSEKQQQNALNQVRILASVKSPNIIGYKHAFIQSNSLCIVMQFSDDGDLYQKIVQMQKDNQTFEQEKIWKTLIHVTIGLKRLHELNILHRDLKSANVFLNKNGIAKLGDMNVSKIAKQGLLYTQTGTPYYASPEVWKDKPYDAKSDIWSLGCVIYQMTTLKPPFRAEDMDGLYKKVIKGSYAKIGDNFSKNLSNIIKAMLQVNPSNRPSASQLLKTLGPKAAQLNIQIGETEENAQLLKTIRANKNFHYLTQRLPKSNYQNGHQHENNPKLNQSLKGKNQMKNGSNNFNQAKGLNLPKLDKMIKGSVLKGSGIHLQHDKQREKYKHSKVDINQMLKIEGKNNNINNQNQYIRYNYEYQQDKRNAQKDIKAQLRKIYNIRPSPIKKMRKKLQLPKIN